MKSIALSAVGVVVMLGAPLVVGDGYLGLLTQALIAALFAMSFNLLYGQGGMLSFGHAAYFAVGAFATIHAMQAVEGGQLTIPLPAMPLVGGVAALLVGGLVGAFATLRSGAYFSMITLALAELFHSLAPNLIGVFGGETGLSATRMPWLGIAFGSASQVYVFVVVWVAAAILLLYLYRRTLFGQLTLALREGERRLSFMGFNTYRTKVVVFATSSMFAGIAGGLFAIVNETANYSLFGLGYSGAVILQTIVGGASVFLGPALGALLLTVFGHVVSEATRIWLLHQGVLFVLVMLLLPDGIAAAMKRSFGELVRRDGGALQRRAAAIGPWLLIIAGFVFIVEATSRIFLPEYQSVVARTGQWPAVRLFWAEWAPRSLVTWALPVIAIAAGVALLRLPRAIRLRHGTPALANVGDT
ncbi:MAG: branched-chain amino acid ABC transporter permease [Betaproteobacteria bacterium]|nr:branched-chain amino acid ABC transporter permease [Betaproteobacteria bacterium]